MDQTPIKDEAGHGRGEIDLPVDPETLRLVRECLAGRNVGITRLADLIAQDIVLTLEVVGTANRRRPSENVAAIEGVRTAIFRLGSEQLLGLLDSVAVRPDLWSAEVHAEFARIRVLAWRMSFVGRVLALNLNRNLVEDTTLTGLLTPLGLMLACARFHERYVALARKFNKASLIYRLAQDLRFDVYGVQLAYLKSRGIPESLSYVFDREFQCKTPVEAALRFLTNSAAELVDAFDSGKWERYAPSAELPSKSALRFLRLSEQQHTSVFEECGEFLKKTSGATSASQALKALPEKAVAVREKESEAEEPVQPLPKEEGTTFGDFAPPIDYIEVSKESPPELPQHFSESSHAVFDILSKLFGDAKTSEELLKKLLGLLLTSGPYLRVALLIVRSNRRSALVHVALGRGLEDGSDVVVKDPLSPIAMCATKIRSFNAQEAVDLTAPFGVTAYALSPIRVKNFSPVLLYADCGTEKSLPFEARRIFRLVVGLLNATLPHLPGGLPDREEVLLGVLGGG